MQHARTLPLVSSRLGERLSFLAERPVFVLGPLVVAQWIAVVVFTTTTVHNGLLFYQGGDQTYFYTTAWALSDGHLPRTGIGYAWPLVEAPLALLAGPNFLAALPWLFALQFLVLLPAALLLVYALATRIGGRLFGYWAAALWVSVPYLAVPFFVDRYHTQFVEQFLPHALGLSGLGDFPSTVALLLAAWLAFRALDDADLVAGVVAGLAAGFAIGIKPANVLFLPAVFLALAVARRWREALGFGLALVPAAVTLAVWKGRGLGSLPILSFVEVRAAAGAAMLPLLAGLGDLTDQVSWDRLDENFDGLREFFWSVRVLEVIPLAGAVAVARFSLAKATLLGAWLAAFVVLKGASEGASMNSGSFFRLLMPAFPAYFLLAAAIPLLVPTVGPRIAAAYRVRTRPLAWRSRPVVTAAVLLAAIPLVAVATLPLLREPTTASDFTKDLFLPVDHAWDPVARVTSGGVELSWDDRAAGGVDVQYQVWRSEPVRPAPDREPPPVRDGLRCRSGGGATDCAVEMDVIGTTAATVFRDTSAPPGRRVYRVGLLAGWRGEPESADLFVVSDPVTVAVPR
jgi:hypothetical protein